jgi:hypothetical protein
MEGEDERSPSLNEEGHGRRRLLYLLAVPWEIVIPILVFVLLLVVASLGGLGL